MNMTHLSHMRMIDILSTTCCNQLAFFDSVQMCPMSILIEILIKEQGRGHDLLQADENWVENWMTFANLDDQRMHSGSS